MSRADLFVVCKNPECGAEVSPYVTECPYCGRRMQKRAPKLDKALQPARRPRRVPTPSLGRLRPGEIPGIRAESGPYATGALILGTCAIWIATRGGWLNAGDLVARHPLGSHWWTVFTATFTYFAGQIAGAGVFQFATLLAIAIFGWLLERRHGPLVVLALFAAGAAGGDFIASVANVNSHVIAGGNGGALALVCAWAVPDLLARRSRREYGGDLLGAGVIAVMLLAMPLVRPEANAVAGGIGVVTGYLGGLALSRHQTA